MVAFAFQREDPGVDLRGLRCNPAPKKRRSFCLARGSCYVLSFPFGWLHAYWCVCTHVCMYVGTNAYAYVCMCVCMYVCMSCRVRTQCLLLIIGSKEILSIEICVPQMRLAIISYRCCCGYSLKAKTFSSTPVVEYSVPRRVAVGLPCHLVVGGAAGALATPVERRARLATSGGERLRFQKQLLV